MASERNDLINLAEEHEDMFDRMMADQGITTSRADWKARALAAEAKISRLEAEVEALRNPWSSDMAAKPRVENVLVYQPAVISGRTRLPARITTESNAGYVREITHWMVPAPPRTEGERA